MTTENDLPPLYGMRGSLREKLAAMRAGQIIQFPVAEVKWEALNTARKRARYDSDRTRGSGLKYQIKRVADYYVVAAYDPDAPLPIIGQPQEERDQLRELIRDIVREELEFLK